MSITLELSRWQFIIDLRDIFTFRILDYEAKCGCAITYFWIFSLISNSKMCYLSPDESDEDVQFEMFDDED